MDVNKYIFSPSLKNFFNDLRHLTLKEINRRIEEVSGIETFFDKAEEWETFLNKHLLPAKNSIRPAAEYGDFQTPFQLTEQILKLLKKKNIRPAILIEPTAGKGNFILSALRHMPALQNIYAIEIYKPYIWESKFKILDYFLQNPRSVYPKIRFYHADIFQFDMAFIRKKHRNREILIAGNPPWVTNAALSVMKSSNLPVKTNYKKMRGIDALTGKGNFDIGEAVTRKMLENFSGMKGTFAFLIKNSVIKNIVYEQHGKKYLLSEMEQHNIDAPKEFSAAVKAALFVSKMGKGADDFIDVYDFYTPGKIKQYGWVGDKFVADMQLYGQTRFLEGNFPIEWRQGIKHDAAKIMELKKINGKYVNKLNREAELEDGLIYGLIKGSQLKAPEIRKPEKFIIIPQKHVGQETAYIQKDFPLTYAYLMENKTFFDRRKSRIYKNKPPFSIFGIGEYAFKPYKVAIAAMYDDFHFSLVYPYKNKPVMLDDTVYYIGFDTLADAQITRYLLNTDLTRNFLRSITFPGSKRMVTKDILMRIDLAELTRRIPYEEIQRNVPGIDRMQWTAFKEKIRRPVISDIFDVIENSKIKHVNKT